MSGLTLDEVSKDLEIPVLSLEQIEDGNIGAFKDIFVLKDYLESYAKYLGLDYEDVIDEFNEYMFEKTSKIPMEEIEKAVKEKEKEESESNRIASPYTKAAPIKSNKQFIFMLILITKKAHSYAYRIKRVLLEFRCLLPDKTLCNY